MDYPHGNALVRVGLPMRFEEHDVTTLAMRDEPVWSSAQIAAALGYAQSGQMAMNMARDWSADLVDGVDYHVLSGEDLAALKAAAPGLVGKNAAKLLVLTESGVNLVSMLTRQPAGVRLRRWLATELLPALRRGQIAPRTDARDDNALALLDGGLPGLQHLRAVNVLERLAARADHLKDAELANVLRNTADHVAGAEIARWRLERHMSVRRKGCAPLVWPAEVVALELAVLCTQRKDGLPNALDKRRIAEDAGWTREAVHELLVALVVELPPASEWTAIRTLFRHVRRVATAFGGGAA